MVVERLLTSGGAEMNDTTVLSVRISKTAKKRLERIAKHMKRSQSYLAAEAIDDFIAIQEWQIKGIRDALGALDRGDGIPHDDVKAWIDSWDSEDECAVPKRR